MESVLIIDDHQGILETYSTILRLGGFEAATTATGKAGIDLARSRNFDVHIVDRRLPDMDGIDVVRALKLNHVTGRIVVVTAFPTLDSSFDAAAEGADGYVDGPLFGDEIVEVVNQALNGPFPVHHPTRPRMSDQVNERERVVEPPSAIDPRVREAMAILDSDLAKPWKVGDLASRVDVSESRLRHLFNAQIGLTVTKFRMERRLGVGARLLSTTYEDVRQIAHGLGFTAQGFRRALLARFGVTPAEYRSKFWRGSGSPIQDEQ